MKKNNARLTTRAGKEYNILIDSEERVTPDNLTEKTVWAFPMKSGARLIISGRNIDSIMVEPEKTTF